MAEAIARARRVHVLPRASSAWEAGLFIANSLLLSHGIRRDSLAIVGLWGRWIAVPGWSARHVRPDQDSMEGWVKSVLRGSRLGAIVSKTPPSSPGGYTCIHTGGGGLEGALGLPLLAAYNPPQDWDCRASAGTGLEAPVWMAPGLVNALLDRIEASLSHH